MILADTSVWVEHFREPHSPLVPALESGRILSHPHVAGELLLGGLSDLALRLYQRLPAATLASDAEVHAMIARHTFSGAGIGYIDAHLLASTLLTPESRLLTRDRKLATVASRLGLAA